MSVLIQGAHCPDECRLCKLLDYDRGYRCVITGILVDLRKNGRPEHCPLLSVPEHGRLIDADALKFVNGFEEDDPLDYIRRYSIDDAPTIIPAEEGE